MGIADDVIYLSLVVFTIVFGKAYKAYNGNRKLLGLIVGFLVCSLVSGYHILHVLIIILMNAAIIIFYKRKCHVLSIVLTFSYLVFFRCSSYFGLPHPPAFTNAVVMILTLKMVGLSFEVCDTSERRRSISKAHDEGRKEDIQKLELESKYRDIQPAFLDVFCYGFCYIGILTGPYYKFRVWLDMVENKEFSNVPSLKTAVQRMSMVPVFVVLFFIGSYLFPLKYASTDEFFTERSVLFRILYMFPLFFTFRMRLYSAFILSEAACISAGLGAYPKSSEPKYGAGPTKLLALECGDEGPQIVDESQLSFETIRNVDPLMSEKTNTVRESMRHWNTTVQYWLAINVYKRVPLKSLRGAITMFVSAYWHGVYPGYYLSLCSAPLAVVCEDVFIKKLKDRYPTLVAAYGLFYKHMFFAYFGLAFLLLEIGTTLQYWMSVYFFGHIVLVLTFLVGYLWPKHPASTKVE